MPDYDQEFMRPLVTGWLEKINLALRSAPRKEWKDVADQCMNFFAGTVGFCWEDKFRRKFMRGSIAPRFRLSLNKAFEVVALFGPLLYHRNPIRVCRPNKRYDVPPELVAELLGVQFSQYREMQRAAQFVEQAYAANQPVPPEAQQQAFLFQRLQQEVGLLLEAEDGERMGIEAGCELMSRYLSYTPYEQPNGGLEQAAEDAITEMLIKGRGLLFPRPYMMPDSDRLLTGCFHEVADDLVSDPDATSFNFGNTMWIALRHEEPDWQVERRFPNIPPGALKGRGARETSEATAARRERPNSRYHYDLKHSFDSCEWWEVWSIGGVGTRLSGSPREMHEAFENVVGDYAYCCVMRGVPWPLNAPVEWMRTATDEQVREAFEWPVPFHRDQHWPCVNMEAYREPGSSYPISLLRPGLGELTFLNVALSLLAGRFWHSTRVLVSVLESAQSYVKSQLESGDEYVVVTLKAIHQDINRVLKEWTPADLPVAAFQILEQFFQLFDKRTGLSDLMYGMNPGKAVSRSATDIAAKRENLSVRPDHLSKKVDAAMSELARMEKWCAYWAGVEGKDVRPLFGSLGAALWDRHITAADPEVVLREMEATTEGTTRKRNKDRDAQAISQVYQPWSNQAANHAQMTGNGRPLDELNRRLADALDIDFEGMEMGSWLPPPSNAPDPAELEAAAKQAELAMDEASHDQEMRQDGEKHRQEMQQDREEHQQKMKLEKAKARLQRIQSTQKKDAA